MIRSDKIVIRAATGLKSGHVMVIKGSEIIYQYSKPTTALMDILLTTPNAVAFVAPGVKRSLDLQISKLERAKANAVPDAKS